MLFGLGCITSFTVSLAKVSHFWNRRRRSPSVRIPFRRPPWSVTASIPSPFSLMMTTASFSGVSSVTAGELSPLCIRSATRNSKRLPSRPAGWLRAKSSRVKERARSRATASASPKAMTAVVLEVGARPSGQASCETAAVRWMSACRAMVDSGWAVMQIRQMFLRFNAGRMAEISSLSPELEMASTTSPSTIMPKSPWAASAGWTKNAGVPVEASVAAILWPTWPDFPIPMTTSRPVQERMVSAAAANVPLRPSEISFRPSASICNTSLAHSMYCSASFVCMVSALFKYGVSRRMRSLFISI